MDENFFVEILVQKETQRRSKNVTRALCCQSEHKVKSVYNEVDNTKDPIRSHMQHLLYTS